MQTSQVNAHLFRLVVRVIDYSIASKDILSICSSLIVRYSIASPHMSLKLGLRCAVEKEEMKAQERILESKIVWDEAVADVLC